MWKFTQPAQVPEASGVECTITGTSTSTDTVNPNLTKDPVATPHLDVDINVDITIDTQSRPSQLVSSTKRGACPVDDELLPRSKRLNLNDPYQPLSPSGSSKAKTVALLSNPQEANTSLCHMREITMGDISDSATMEEQEAEDEIPRFSRSEKGKAKMRAVPELPEEIWKRVFEVYYDQCAEGELYHTNSSPKSLPESQHNMFWSAMLQNEVQKYLLSPTLTRSCCLHLPRYMMNLTL